MNAESEPVEPVGRIKTGRPKRPGNPPSGSSLTTTALIRPTAGSLDGTKWNPGPPRPALPGFRYTPSRLLVWLLLSLPAAAAPSIPPEVLSAMEPAVLGGQRPRIAHLQRGDIFQLQAQPRMDTDLVSLDLDPTELNSAELAILRGWLAKGVLPVLLQDLAIERFAPLFGLTPGQRLDSLEGDIIHPPLSHDCERVTFGSEAGYFLRHFYFETPPPGLVSLAEDFQGRSVCGRFEHGKTAVFFCNSMIGPDAPRCALNFRHWVLGFEVPPSAVRLRATP